MTPLKPGHFEKLRGLAASPDGTSLVWVGDRVGPTSHLWRVGVDGKTVQSAALSSHGRAVVVQGPYAVVATTEGSVIAFDLARDLAESLRLAGHPGGATALAVFPDGDRVASVGVDGVARVWSLAGGVCVSSWPLSDAPLRAVAVDATGEFLGAAGDDGVVRVVTLATGATRAMPGHEGAVWALAFTARDGRIASAGEDALIRLWYLAGAVECELRGQDDSGHKGPVLSLCVIAATGDAADPGERLCAGDATGAVKVWRLEDRRKPRTLDAGPGAVTALAYMAGAAAGGGAGSVGVLVTASEGRRVSRFVVDGTGVQEKRTVAQDGFDLLQAALREAPAARLTAYRTLAALDEPEAAPMLGAQLAREADAALRVSALEAIVAAGRVTARSFVRERLDDKDATVRTAALATLRGLDGAASVEPLRAALGSRFADMRVAALGSLPGVRAGSALVPGLVTGALTDADETVRVAALDALTALHPPDAVEPLRVGYERGPSSLKLEVLVRVAARGLAADAVMAPVVSLALDDDDAAVRRCAFAVKVLHRRGLLTALGKRDEALTHAIADIVRRVALRRRPTGGAASAVTAAEEASTLALLPGVPAVAGGVVPDDLEPLLTALTCSHADTALRGARGLSLLGDARALGALLQISRDGDAALRQEGARALRVLDDDRARRRLVAMLDDAEASVRSAALDAYAACAGVTGLAVARAALRSSHEDLRVRGLELLVKQGPGGAAETGPEAQLGATLDDESARVRTEAFRTLLAWHKDDPASALARALAGRFADVRVRAVDELFSRAAEPWALAMLRSAVADRDAGVAGAAYEAVVRKVGAEEPEIHRAALASRHRVVRALGAFRCRGCSAEAVWEWLRVHLDDDVGVVRVTALQSLDALGLGRDDHLLEALASPAADLQVAAAELGVSRGLVALVEPMRRLLGDTQLGVRLGAAEAEGLRVRAAGALAALGHPSLVGYFSTSLLRDAVGSVRAHAARGLARASRPGDEAPLLDALGHNDPWVRAAAADGLARLGDLRGLPVLVGNLRHSTTALRAAALASFAALGSDGEAGLVQGLEDAERPLREAVLGVVLARDLRAWSAGREPALLTSALASERPEVRVRAARALELRVEPEGYLGHVLEVLTPPGVVRGVAPKTWPAEEVRRARLSGLAVALASDDAALRYDATATLFATTDPVSFFASLQRFETTSAPTAGCAPATAEAASTLRRLAFGAYVGLLRQASTDEEGHKARREAVERVTALGAFAEVGLVAAVATLARALDDGHHLVRRAALTGLEALYPNDQEAPLVLALTASSPDVAKVALDQLAARGESALGRVREALGARHPEVRKHAFALLERLSPQGSLDPLLAALASDYDDLRLGVIERLARTDDARVTSALERAVESAHDDLRLRAGELLAERGGAKAGLVLGAFLGDDRGAYAARAREALVALGQRGQAAAVEALAGRLEAVAEGARSTLLEALGRSRHPAALAVLVGRFDDADGACRGTAFAGALAVVGLDPKRRDEARWLETLTLAARVRDPMLRKAAAGHLATCTLPGADEVLLGLFHDRASLVRDEAVRAYATRVKSLGSPATPLEAVLQAGQRSLVLPSAEALAHRGSSLALRPLLLVSRAGEPAERATALLALGTLGDARALPELESLAIGTTPDQVIDPAMQDAAIEALGRLAPRLTEVEARVRVVDRVEAATGPTSPERLRIAGIRGLSALGGERSRSLLEGLLLDRGASDAVRIAAAQALGKLGDVRAEEALALALRTAEEAVCRAAEAALSAVFPHEPTRIALLVVQSPEESVSELAAAYLADKGDAAVLVSRLGDLPSASLRMRLRYGLLRRAAAPAEALATLLGHASATGRQEAARLVGAAPAGVWSADEATRVDEALAQSLAASPQRYANARTPDDKEPEAAAWAWCLWATRGRSVVGSTASARTWLADAEVPTAVRVAAAEVLGASREAPAEAEKALAAALTDTEVSVRESAAAALEALLGARAGVLAAAVVPSDPVSFAATVRAPGASAALVASPAGRALGLASLVARREAGPLVALVRAGGDAAARSEAVAALGRIGGDEATTLLTELAFAKGSEVALRKAAYRALRRARRATAAAMQEGAQ